MLKVEGSSTVWDVFQGDTFLSILCNPHQHTFQKSFLYFILFLTVNIFPRTKWLRTAEGQLYYSKVNVPEQWGWLHFEYKTSMAEIIMITQSNPIMYQVAAISGTVHLCLWAISLQLC